MLENHKYNLMEQMTKESQSLWRIKKKYKKEAECDKCKAFWEKLEKDKEQHIEDLHDLIINHME